ncbi:MAG: Cysteine synthase [Phycisphaerae bacterium]|nr:Cysteine synthase [Phycisphaerae bacterium]
MSDYVPPLAGSIVDVIGHTPMVELKRIVASRGLRGRLLAKLEHLNPGFSKKDRIALGMVRQAREAGWLAEGQTVVELTSGNTGTGLAIVCGALGHPFIAVMSRGNTIERARMMAALGAQVVLVDQAPGSPPNQVSGEDLALVEQRTQQIVAERGAFRTDQFRLTGNVAAHEFTTGPEIWTQSGGAVDVLVDYLGTGGTITGIARALRKCNPGLRAYAVEPATAAVLAGRPVTRSSHKIQGGGYNMPELPLLDRSLITDFVQVSDEQAIAGARALARDEGIFGGFSSGAHLAAALDLLAGREAGATVVFLICDSGLKYLSTDLYAWEG